MKCDLPSTQTPRDTQPPPSTQRITSSQRNFMSFIFFLKLHILNIACILYKESSLCWLFFRLILSSSRMHWFWFCHQTLRHLKSNRRPCPNQVKSSFRCHTSWNLWVTLVFLQSLQRQTGTKQAMWTHIIKYNLLFMSIWLYLERPFPFNKSPKQRERGWLCELNKWISPHADSAVHLHTEPKAQAQSQLADKFSSLHHHGWTTGMVCLFYGASSTKSGFPLFTHKKMYVCVK